MFRGGANTSSPSGNVKILLLLSDGSSNRATAQKLFLSEKTVETHHHTQAAMMALRFGEEPVPDAAPEMAAPR